MSVLIPAQIIILCPCHWRAIKIRHLYPMNVLVQALLLPNENSHVVSLFPFASLGDASPCSPCSWKTSYIIHFTGSGRALWLGTLQLWQESIADCRVLLTESLSGAFFVRLLRNGKYCAPGAWPEHGITRKPPPDKALTSIPYPFDSPHITEGLWYSPLLRGGWAGFVEVKLKILGGIKIATMNVSFLFGEFSKKRFALYFLLHFISLSVITLEKATEIWSPLVLPPCQIARVC